MADAKVLIYRNELLPLSETFILSQANALRRFTPVFAGLKRVDNSLCLKRHKTYTVSASDSPREKLKRYVFLRSGLSLSFSRMIATQMPKIVHAHFAIDAGAVLPVARKHRVPLIVTLHGYDVACAEKLLRHWPAARAYMRRKAGLFEYASLFLCVSEHIKLHAMAHGFPEEKLRVHYTGIDLNMAAEEHRYRNRSLILFVGRLVEKKGCSYLIRAMSRIRQAAPEAQLVIAGDGPLRVSLQSEAAQHCADAVFLGYQTHDAVRQWMRQARVLAAPSVRGSNGDTEGLPTVLCEAQAEGLPPVAFATSGVTEAFPCERRALLPEEGDVAGLADQIAHLLRDDDAWAQASRAGRNFVASRFDIHRQTQILEDRYEDAIASYRG